MRVESQVIDLESKLAKLQAGHEAGAAIIRQKATGLAALPKELRDAIFEMMYVEKTPVEISWSRVGSKFLFEMPKDPGLYMSVLHVGLQLAREAAEIFYKHNTFTFVRIANNRNCYNPGFSNWEAEHLSSWFDTDHYGSGCTPKDFVRKLEIRLDPPGYCFNDGVYYSWSGDNAIKLCNHIEMENLCSNVTRDWQDYRGRLRFLHESLEGTLLQHINIVVPPQGDRFDTVARIINPFIRTTREIGLKVTFEQYTPETGDSPAEQVDLSDIFDTPSDSDYAEYFARTERKSTFEDDPERDMFDTWKLVDAGSHDVQVINDKAIDAYNVETVKKGFLRTWMHEHHEMYKFICRQGDQYLIIKEMASEIRGLSSEQRQIRRQMYSRMMDHLA